MFRLRRYRLFLIFAVFTIAILYHFTNVRDWESVTADRLKYFGHTDDTPSSPEVPPEVPKEALGNAGDPLATTSSDEAHTSIGATAALETTNPNEAVPPTPIEQPNTVADQGSPITQTPSAPLTPTNAVTEVIQNTPAQQQTPQGQVSTLTESPSPGTSTAEAAQQVSPQSPTIGGSPLTTVQSPEADSLGDENELVQEGRGRHEAAPLLPGKPTIHWSNLPEHFPVPSESVIPLPTGKLATIPKVQFDFKDESSDSRIDRERKLVSIKEAFQHAWTGYSGKAWMHDELSPISGDFRDPFCGWAATLVDSLDTLWIMGMKEEFERAVASVKSIDFTTSVRNDIPLFETTIRYLGGLLSAYDLSGGSYETLLEKAEQLGDVLMGAFDTPNRMPMTFYYWKPTFASNPHRAQTRVVLAEIGSLSVEFTRLAQITKKAKYYDAIARITNELDLWQNSTKMPGLWPKSVDASGCKKPDSMLTTPLEHSMLNGPGAVKPQMVKAGSEAYLKIASQAATQSPDQTTAANNQASTVNDGGFQKSKIQNWGIPAEEAGSGKTPPQPAQVPEAETPQQPNLGKRQLSPESLPQSSESGDEEPNSKEPTPDCEPQGLASPPKSITEQFTFGGQADSVYEYLPKQYMLLGGLNQQYRSMYEKAIDAANKYLLFRPALPDTRNILVLGTGIASGNPDEPDNLEIKPNQEHLLCFAGGMYAIGSKIFGRKSDMDFAAKLTDGCVWAYESTRTGIMPEEFSMIPCKSREKCEWNETQWHEALDPYRALREQSYRSQQQTVIKAEDQLTPPEDSQDAQKSDRPAASATPSPTPSPSPDSAEAQPSPPASGSLAKRQLGVIENELPGSLVPPGDAISGTSTVGDIHQVPGGAQGQPIASINGSAIPAFTPKPFPTHEEFVQARLKEERLPTGVPSIVSRKYILRPEAIESVFIMYRVTGDDYWREKGWAMFSAIQNYTRTEFGNSAIADVTSEAPYGLDEMESFWLAETLKYFYLLYSDPSLISLDDYVLNTEAHAFKRPK